MKNNKNNKGFSLVELIVVVLIMAIIAVALAPQVMKWVNNSRISTDMQTKDALVSAYTTALTNEKAYADLASLANDPASVTFTNGKKIDATDAAAFEVGNKAINAKAAEYFGASSVSIKTSDYKIEISITKKGVVTGKLLKGDGTAVTGLDD